jgi:hypothetical protein
VLISKAKLQKETIVPLWLDAVDFKHLLSPCGWNGKIVNVYRGNNNELARGLSVNLK